MVLAPSRAQDPPQPPIPTEMEERVLVQLIQMPILARDRQGRPVTDLRAAELEVKLRGRTLPLAYLEPVLPPPSPPKEVERVRLFLDAPGGWNEPVASEETVTRYVAFLLDNENDDPLRRQEALTKTLEFLDSDLEPEARAAVLVYNGETRLELPFTTDRSALRTAILRASSREGRPRIDREARMRRFLDRMDDCATSRSDFGNIADPQCLRDVSNEYIGEVRPRALDFIRGLDGIVQYMGGLRGRKTVFVLSHGLPVDPAPVVIDAARAMFGNADAISELQLYVGFGDEPRILMDRLLDSLVRNRVSLSFVDRASVPSGDFQASKGRMTSPGISPMRAEYDATIADMEQIAATSGGVHIRATDMTAALRQAFDSQKGSYEIGFQTAEYLDSDKLEKVSVDCSRRGVRITHRRGVYAAPSETESRLRGRIAFPGGKRTEAEGFPGIRQPFRLEVDPESIGYDVREGGADATFTLHFEVLSDAGVPLVDSYHFISHSYDGETWNAPDRAPMTLTGWVELPPGDFSLKAAVRNVRTGLEGFVRQSVRVPETSPPPAESNPSGQD
jgi:VWFA-related protein